jgi:predicted DNA binding CopG/RHH family protein
MNEQNMTEFTAITVELDESTLARVKRVAEAHGLTRRTGLPLQTITLFNVKEL